MRRMLRLAAEEGYDKVAWTNGNMQAKRYSLSEKIDDFYYKPNGDGTYKISAVANVSRGHGDGRYNDSKEFKYDSMPEVDLAKYFGKDIAEMIVTGKGRSNYQHNGESGWTTFKGKDLELGGEGMKGFYDEMLPRFIDKYGKQWGVKTQDIELPVGNGKWHSVDVTPEMKKSVMEGQVMFSKHSGNEERRAINSTIDQATAFVTGKSLKEVRLERQNAELERRVRARELYQRVLNNQFDDLTLQLIDNYIKDATPKNPYGRRISKRLPQKMERGLHEGKRINAVDALFSRISEGAVEKASRNSQEGRRRRIAENKKELLKGWAIATGNWHTSIDDFVSDPTEIGHGKDSQVYASKNPDRVIKVSKGKNEEKRFSPDIDAVNLFNFVFPNMAYEIKGYGEIDGKFVKFLEQQAVGFNSDVKVSDNERGDYMESLGFRPLNDEKTLFTNDELIVADLQKANVVKDVTGKIRVIDADVKLHTRDIGGKYTYPDVEVDIAVDSDNKNVETISSRAALGQETNDVHTEGIESEAIPAEDEPTLFSKMPKEEWPEKTIDVVKLMRLGEDRELYPLFIDRNAEPRTARHTSLTRTEMSSRNIYKWN